MNRMDTSNDATSRNKLLKRNLSRRVCQEESVKSLSRRVRQEESADSYPAIEYKEASWKRFDKRFQTLFPF